MKLKIILLSLLVGSVAQARWNSPNLCGTKESRLLSCGVENSQYSIDMCRVGNSTTEVVFVASDGKTMKGKHVRKRGSNMIYKTESLNWVITTSLHGGFCLIDTDSEVLRGEGVVVYDNMLPMSFYDEVYAFWKSL